MEPPSIYHETWNWRILLALSFILSITPGSWPAQQAMDADISAGLAYLRDSSADGRAMADYILKDPVSIGFTRLPSGILGLYRREPWRHVGGEILLQDSLRALGPREIGEVLYHEYIHRVQDRFHSTGPSHSQAEARTALEHVCQEVSCDTAILDSPMAAERRKEFGQATAFMPLAEMQVMRQYEALHPLSARKTLAPTAWFTPWKIDMANVRFNSAEPKQ